MYPYKLGKQIRKEVRAEQARRQYKERLRILRSIGFDSYKAYLCSNLWDEIRQKVLSKSNKCTLCGNSATEVHHQRYCQSDLLGTSLENLIPICRGCHQESEFIAGQKLGPAQVKKRTKVIRRRRFKS